MKKLLSTVVLSAMACISLNADYKVVLTDVDGNQTQECIKSYSFSNNLESISRKKSDIDEYSSTKEILTKKVWDGKPVYRRVFKDISGFNEDGSFNNWKIISFNNETDNIEKVVSGEIDFNNRHEFFSVYNPNYSQFRYSISQYGINYVSKGGFVNSNTKATVILEYTKTTDTANTSSNTFKSYLHYTPSSSTIDEVITKDMKDLGVQFLEGYSYNPDTSSCDKIQ